MSEPHDANDGHDSRTPSKANWALLVFLAIAGFFLFTEHRAHLFGVLPFLLLLICPLMHFFMHGRHGDHRHDRNEQTKGGAR